MSTLISSDNTWMLWAVMTSIATLSILLEQRYRWAGRITGCVLALTGMMVLSNLRIVPTESSVYDQVWDYVVPLAVPLLLFQCDIRRIGRETGRLLGVFLLSASGTAAGTFLAVRFFGSRISELEAVTAMFTGTYIGGSVNLVAMADAFHASEGLTPAIIVADDLLMALLFFVLIEISELRFFQRHFRHIASLDFAAARHPEEIPENDEKTFPSSDGAYSATGTASSVSTADIAFSFASAASIVAVSRLFAGFASGIIPETGVISGLFHTLLGNPYLVITTVTMLLATLFPGIFGSARGSGEIGTFLIYIFFAAIGAPASFHAIVQHSPLYFLFAAVIVGTNLILSLLAGKLFHFTLEEILIASNANIGGPTTAAAMATSRGWNSLVAPALLVGTLGYVLGNYAGILAASFLAA